MVYHRSAMSYMHFWIIFFCMHLKHKWFENTSPMTVMTRSL